MGLAAEETDGGGTPTQLNSVTHKRVVLGDARLAVGGLVDTRPRGQAVVAVTAHRRVTDRGVRRALREVDAVREVVADTRVLNDHAVGVGHLAGVHVVAHPEAALEVLDPHVGDAGVRTCGTGKALVLRLLIKARLQVRGHVEVGHGHAAHAAVEDEAAAASLIGGEAHVGVPHARALDRQVGVVQADLAAELPRACGNVDGLGGGRRLVHRPDERVGVVDAVIGLGSLIVGHAHSAFRALDGGRGLLELDEVDAIGVLIVTDLDDLNMIILLDLAVKEGVDLVETEARLRALSRLVVHVVAADVLPGSLGGEVEGRDRLVVDAHVDTTGGVIRQGEAQVEGVGRGARREVHGGVLVIQGHVGLARGLDGRRFEVVGALERRPVGTARLLGLVSRVGDGRAVLLVGRDRTGDQCGHQRDDAEQACSGDKWSAFHVTLQPLFMPLKHAHCAASLLGSACWKEPGHIVAESDHCQRVAQKFSQSRTVQL